MLSTVPNEMPSVIGRLSRGVPAYSPPFGLVAVPEGQVFYGEDWVARRSLGSVIPPEEQLRDWAKEMAALLVESTGEAWVVGPAEFGPSLAEVLRRNA